LPADRDGALGTDAQARSADRGRAEEILLRVPARHLLRGDLKSRYEAYAIARNWGWLNVDDIRERENMNGLPNGDIYLQPLNMIEAGTTAAAGSAAGRESRQATRDHAGRGERMIKHLSVIAARGEDAILLNGHGAHDD
jgi:hypothetical protein